MQVRHFLLVAKTTCYLFNVPRLRYSFSFWCSSGRCDDTDTQICFLCVDGVWHVLNSGYAHISMTWRIMNAFAVAILIKVVVRVTVCTYFSIVVYSRAILRIHFCLWHFVYNYNIIIVTLYLIEFKHGLFIRSFLIIQVLIREIFLRVACLLFHLGGIQDQCLSALGWKITFRAHHSSASTTVHLIRIWIQPFLWWFKLIILQLEVSITYMYFAIWIEILVQTELFFFLCR